MKRSDRARAHVKSRASTNGIRVSHLSFLRSSLSIQRRLRWAGSDGRALQQQRAVSARNGNLRSSSPGILVQQRPASSSFSSRTTTCRRMMNAGFGQQQGGDSGAPRRASTTGKKGKVCPLHVGDGHTVVHHIRVAVASKTIRVSCPFRLPASIFSEFSGFHIDTKAVRIEGLLPWCWCVTKAVRPLLFFCTTKWSCLAWQIRGAATELFT